ncbi:MAG: DivIVA domain-containing protein [Acetobacter sp.]|nr:DivIVA domain-containing protein [Bacteroides sp.]MCM1340241.1 DivIVA domain-containing protein [Acetobacter sp.]MCM1432807.1 DivIVA domain-containing protein [Clostridiales bacterium]
MLTPKQMREKKLTVVESQGYDREEVNVFLAEVIESYEALVEENKGLYRKMDVLANRIEEYRADEDSIKMAILNAQKTAKKISSEARENADNAIKESNVSAQKIVSDAQEKADKAIAEARDFVAQLTAEKTQEAEHIVASAEKKANDAINGAKVLGNAALVQAQLLSKDLVSKAKAEAEFYADLADKIKADSDDFSASLTALYNAQLSKISELKHQQLDLSDKENEIASIDEELSKKLAAIEEIIGVQGKDNKADNDEDETVAEEEIIQQNEAEEKIAEETDEEISKSADISAVQAEEEEIDEILESLESTTAHNIAEEDNFENETQPSEEEVQSALDAFTADEITPIDESVNSIPEISDEPEFESAMPFENFFNVDKEAGNTDEIISLIPPEYDEDEDDDNGKFKGFFKKKK